MRDTTTPARDGRGDVAVDALTDDLGAGDASPDSGADQGSPAKCTGWTDWFCLITAGNGCRATCKDEGGTLRQINCAADGTCDCTTSGGTGADACSTVAPSSVPCGLCTQAVSKGCCLP